MVIQFPAPRFALLAKRAADRAPDSPPDALAALVFSVVWIEAAANEILFEVRHALCPHIEATARLHVATNAPGLLDRASLQVKLQLIPAALRGTPFNTGEQPFQDFDLLLKLRNHVVHLQPEIVEPAQHDYGSERWSRVSKDLARHVRKLIERGVVPAQDERNAYSLTSVLEHPDTARWAVHNAARMVRALIDVLPQYGHWPGVFLVRYDPYPELRALLDRA